jgi:hypothetical protein
MRRGHKVSLWAFKDPRSQLLLQHNIYVAFVKLTTLMLSCATCRNEDAVMVRFLNCTVRYSYR